MAVCRGGYIAYAKKLPLRNQRHWQVVSGYRGHPPPPPPAHPAAAGSVGVGRGGLRRAGGPCCGVPPRTMPHAARRSAPANCAYAGRWGRSGSGLGRRVRAFPFFFGFCRVLEVRLLNIMFVWGRRGRVWTGLFPFF